MGGPFLSIMQTVAQRADDGRFSVGQKAFGELQRWPRCKKDCLDSRIRSRTPSPSGRTISGNRRSQSGNYSAKPTGLKARRTFRDLQFVIGTLWRLLYPVWLNLVRRSFMVQVTSRFFPNCCAGNWVAAA